MSGPFRPFFSFYSFFFILRTKRKISRKEPSLLCGGFPISSDQQPLVSPLVILFQIIMTFPPIFSPLQLRSFKLGLRSQLFPHIVPDSAYCSNHHTFSHFFIITKDYYLYVYISFLLAVDIFLYPFF
jgi:hypothetical protein